MADITLPSKAQYQDIIDATFLFIESVTASLGVFVEIFYHDGGKERQAIVSGSKFLQGQDGQKIAKVIFHNPSLLSANISYRYSTIFGYDEARVIGNINSLTTPENLSKNSASFFGGFESAALASNYSFIGLRNPTGSGVTVYVENIMLGSTGNTVMLLRHNASGMSDLPVFTVEHNKQLYGARAAARVQSAAVTTTLPAGGAQADIIGTVPTDTQGSVSQVKMHGRPIELGEGEAIAARGIVVNTNVAAFFEWFEE